MSDDSEWRGESEVEATPTHAGTGGVPREVLEIDYLYAAIGHPRRRYVCYTLYEDDEWSLRELARNIAAWENDVPLAGVSDDQLRDVYVSLYHAHVPKLAEIGVLEFDAEREVISAARHADEVLAALEGIGGSFDAIQEAHARGTNE